MTARFRSTVSNFRRRRRTFRDWPRSGKALIILSPVLLLALIAGAALALGSRYDSQIKREDLLGTAVPQQVQRQHIASGPINLLLLGSDSRQGEPDQADVSGQRSDTIMLVHVAASRDRAAVISIPRDSFVYVPAGGSWRGGQTKINAALAYGGAPLAAKTVTRLTGVTLDGAIIANFDGVRRMVDAVGGVTVCIDQDIQSSSSPRVWTAGCHRMDGAEAQEFMRERKNVPGGDFGRMKDQQLVVRSILQEASSAGILSNPVRLDRLLMAATQNLTIDKNLNLPQLVAALRNVKPTAIEFATVPYRNPNLQTFAGSCVELDPQKSPAMFAAIRNDTVTGWIAKNIPS